jgi:hypothetical protein
MYLIIVILFIVLVLYSIKNNKNEAMSICQNDDDCNLGQYCNKNENQSYCIDYKCTYLDGKQGNIDDFLYDANDTESKCKKCSLEIDENNNYVSNWINVSEEYCSYLDCKSSSDTKLCNTNKCIAGDWEYTTSDKLKQKRTIQNKFSKLSENSCPSSELRDLCQTTPWVKSPCYKFQNTNEGNLFNNFEKSISDSFKKKELTDKTGISKWTRSLLPSPSPCPNSIQLSKYVACNLNEYITSPNTKGKCLTDSNWLGHYAQYGGWCVPYGSNVGRNNQYSKPFYRYPRLQYYRAEKKINQYPNKNSIKKNLWGSPWIMNACWPSNTSKSGITTVGLKPMNGICNYQEDAGLLKNDNIIIDSNTMKNKYAFLYLDKDELFEQNIVWFMNNFDIEVPKNINKASTWIEIFGQPLPSPIYVRNNLVTLKPELIKNLRFYNGDEEVSNPKLGYNYIKLNVNNVEYKLHFARPPLGNCYDSVMTMANCSQFTSEDSCNNRAAGGWGKACRWIESEEEKEKKAEEAREAKARIKQEHEKILKRIKKQKEKNPWIRGGPARPGNTHKINLEKIIRKSDG